MTKLSPTELGTRLHQQIEKLMMGDSHIGMGNEQLAAYASGCALATGEVLVLMGGDHLHETAPHDCLFIAEDTLYKADFKTIEERMTLYIADVKTLVRRDPLPIDSKAFDKYREREPKREKARDWEQRGRKRKRK